MSRPTELVALLVDKSEDQRYAVCYARGSVFKPEGHFHRVEKGRRSVVLKALCATTFYGKRCKVCPNYSFSLRLIARGE